MPWEMLGEASRSGVSRGAGSVLYTGKSHSPRPSPLPCFQKASFINRMNQSRPSRRHAALGSQPARDPARGIGLEVQRACLLCSGPRPLSHGDTCCDLLWAVRATWGLGQVSGLGHPFSTELTSQDVRDLKSTHSSRVPWGVGGRGPAGTMRKPWPLGTRTAETTAWRVPWWPPPHQVGCVTASPSSEGDRTWVIECSVDTRQPGAVWGTPPPGWRAQAGVLGGAGAPGFSCRDLRLLSAWG